MYVCILRFYECAIYQSCLEVKRGAVIWSRNLGWSRVRWQMSVSGNCWASPYLHFNHCHSYICCLSHSIPLSHLTFATVCVVQSTCCRPTVCYRGILEPVYSREWQHSLSLGQKTGIGSLAAYLPLYPGPLCIHASPRSMTLDVRVCIGTPSSPLNL